MWSKEPEIIMTSVLILSLLMKYSELISISILFNKSSLHNIVLTDWAMKSNPGTGDLISIGNILRPGD